MNEIKQNENVSKHITHYDPRLVFVFCIIVMTTFPSTGHTLSAIWDAMISFVGLSFWNRHQYQTSVYFNIQGDAHIEASAILLQWWRAR
jgi:hypothetical protein